MVTDRPIIFSAPMVRALLDGRKTQTRRKFELPANSGRMKLSAMPNIRECKWQRGDRLWVREAWRVDAEWDDCPPREFDGADAIHYEADSEQRLHLWGNPFTPGRLRSPIHMSRWASRLTLLVTDVRVQRLQEISDADAKAEGLATVTKDGNLWKFGIPDRDGLPGNDDHGWHWEDWQVDARKAFSRLWNSIHGPGAWEANPWVAAINFTVHRCNIDKMEEGTW